MITFHHLTTFLSIFPTVLIFKLRILAFNPLGYFFSSLLGGSQYMAALYKMQKDYQSFNGSGYLSDPRLVANGFQIKVIEGMMVLKSFSHIGSCSF